jgi:hypothetical protein
VQEDKGNMKKFQQYPPQLQLWPLKYWQVWGLGPDSLKFELDPPDRTKLTKSEKRSLDERIKKYHREFLK